MGRAYAIDINGGSRAELVLDLPSGTYEAGWVDTKTGGDRTLVSPAYSEDIALRVKRSGGG